MPLRALEPKSSASANSATFARISIIASGTALTWHNGGGE